MKRTNRQLKKRLESGSERLTFTEIRESDAPFIVEWRSDPEVYKFFKDPHEITIEEHLSWYRERYPKNHDRCDFMALLKESGERVGVFGVVFDGEEAELNYILAPEYRGKGYASEALLCLMQALDCMEETSEDSHMRVQRFVAEIHKENLSSICLIERLGFTLERTEKKMCFYVKEAGVRNHGQESGTGI